MAAAVLGLAGVERTHVLGPSVLAACEVLPAAELGRIAAVGPAEPFEPEQTGTEATGCTYGRSEPGASLTVFSVGRDGGAFLRRIRASDEAQHIDPGKRLSGPGYVGYVGAGPRPGSESVVVVKHDEYVNVLVDNAPAGTAERLGVLAAHTLE